MPFLTRGRAHYEAIDLTEYLKDSHAERRGIFLLTVSGYTPKKPAHNHAYNPGQGSEMSAADEPNNNCEDECGSQDENDVAPEHQVDKRLILVTDFGIVVKKSLDGSQDIYVQSIYTGKPIEGATVDIVGKNGLTLFSQVTDKSGHTRFAKISGLTRERAPLMVLVRKGSDLSFMPLNRAERGLAVSLAARICGLSSRSSQHGLLPVFGSPLYVFRLTTILFPYLFSCYPLIEAHDSKD